MYVIVTGSRDLTDPSVPEICLNLLYSWALAADESLVIVHGAARGADKICRDWAEWSRLRGDRVTQIPYPAAWNLFGNAAGPIRNRRMWTEHWHQVDLCLAFPAPDSIGTIDCMAVAREYGCPIWSNPAGQPMTRPPAARLIPAHMVGVATNVPPATTL